MSPRLGSLIEGSRRQDPGISAPKTALLTRRKSPTRRVFSIEDVGIKEDSRRNVRTSMKTVREKSVTRTHSLTIRFAIADVFLKSPRPGCSRCRTSPD
jgi:hypothetical protein